MPPAPCIPRWSSGRRTRHARASGLVPELPRPAWIVLGGDALSAVGTGLTLARHQTADRDVEARGSDSPGDRAT